MDKEDIEWLISLLVTIYLSIKKEKPPKRKKPSKRKKR